MVAFLGGGILVNVFREEWPARGPGRTLPFLFGIAQFGVLIATARSFTGSKT